MGGHKGSPATADRSTGVKPVKYKTSEDFPKFPLMVMESSEYSPNQCVYRNDEYGVWLYHANCIEFMDMLIAKYPEGRFDMIFADPPYFLSNGGITCHAGKMQFISLAMS